MTHVDMPILIYSYYRLAGGAEKISKFTPERVAQLPPEPVIDSTPAWRDLTFSNITATATVAGGAIWGKPGLCVSNVNFVNVSLAAPGGFNIYNARGIHFQDCHLKLGGGQKLTTYNADVTTANTTF
jgi:hypothetical protein